MLHMQSIEPASLADRAARAIRDGIRSQSLVPGEVYSVGQVADWLEVSRSPVREALLKLAEAGLVQFSRNKGFRVVLPDPTDVAEIFAIRLALEPAAARRAAVCGVTLATAPTLDSATESGDDDSFWVADRALHDEILRGADNARAARIVSSLRDTTALLGPPTSASFRSLREVRDEHTPIVAAIACRDGDAAEAAMRLHLVRTGRLLMAQLAGVGAGSAEVSAIWDRVVNR